MAGGLFALLDDVAALARIAAASVDDVGAAAARASAKAAGVVVDDTAVTPQYLHGSAANRELPIIKQIAVGSLRNKLLFILPAAVLLGQFLPGLLPVILIFGGAFLAYEGAHKVHERLTGHATEADQEVAPTGEFTPEHEQRTIAQAIRTDFILSAEIMVIALKEVVGSDPDASIWMRAIVLAVVAVLITVLVYGVVALIVKMDDVGLHLDPEAPRRPFAAPRPRPRLRHAPPADASIGAHRHRSPCSGSVATSSWSASTRSAVTTACSRAPASATCCTRSYDLGAPPRRRPSTTRIGAALGATGRLAAQHRWSPRSSDSWSASSS
jgi:predicted DNA repair protein MutK